MSRQDQARVTLKVDDIDVGVAMGNTGGDADSEESTIHPGGMALRVSLGGQQTVENVTATFLATRELRGKLPALRAQRGKGRAVVTEQPLDVDGNAFDLPTVYVGTLKRVGKPEYDANSTDAASVEFEVTVEAVS